MIEAREKTPLQDNSHMFKKSTNLHPATYDGVLNRKVFDDRIRGMKKLFDTLQYPEEWSKGFVGLYLGEEAGLWWATMRNWQYEPGFGCREFKNLFKNRFYPVSLQKVKEDEFIVLQQGRMSVLEYASKFMELSSFTAAYVDGEKLKMNRFEAELILGVKEKILV